MGAQQDAAGDVDDAGQRQSGADQRSLRRQAGDQLQGQPAEPFEHRAGVAADEVAVLDLLGDDPAAQVDHPGREQPGVDLQPQRGDRDPGASGVAGGRGGPSGRPSTSSSSPAATRSSASRAAVARVMPVAAGDVGPGRRLGRGAHRAQHERQVRRAHRATVERLAGVRGHPFRLGVTWRYCSSAKQILDPPGGTHS